MPVDTRHLDTGCEIPSEGYCDQPYVVVNQDGSWTCTMTTGSGLEGSRGQHVVSLVSKDHGKTWDGPFDIEPAAGPEASWVMPLKVPATGRIYAFYTYNRDNLREVKSVDSNEGVLFRSPNLLTEPDPARNAWETLPEGETGLRTPAGGGPIAGELNVTPMGDGSLYGTYRTIDGWPCHAYSRDGGRTWEREYMTYTPGGRRVKNPRAANFVRRFSNGKYLYWFHFHGGEVLGRTPGVRSWIGYEHRNPVWLCGGIEKDGKIYWSQPEIALYEDNPGVRISYPDFIEENGRRWVTETRKDIARVHELDPKLVAALWSEPRTASMIPDGLLLEHAGGRGSINMPELPTLHNRAVGMVDADTSALLPGMTRSIEARGGLSLELHVRFESLRPWQVLFDSRDDEGKGLLLQLTDRGSLRLNMAGHTHAEPGGRWSCGLCESAWASDCGLFKVGRQHHVAFIIDGGPKIVTVLVDGVLCDGGTDRQYGWGRFHPLLKDLNGAHTARVAPDMDGDIRLLRLYGRALFSAEMVAQWACDLNRVGCLRRMGSARVDSPASERG